jgi:hypothetical protein
MHMMAQMHNGDHPDRLEATGRDSPLHQLIQCRRSKRPAYSMAAEAIAALKNNAGSHHPCIAKNPDNDPANHRSGFGADLIKLQ